MAGFRVALAIGGAVTIALTVAGLYPVALVTAAALMPLLTVLYFVDVDVYESEPVRVLALTIAWGVVAGVAVGILSRAVAPPASDIGTATGSRLWWDGLVVPVVSFGLALAGPLFLLGYRRFNDVLDGATFGAACAVVLTSTRVVIAAFPLLTRACDRWARCPPGWRRSC